MGQGWLKKFKGCHGIHQFWIVGRKLSADLESSGPFTERLHMLIQKNCLQLELLYNADKTGLSGGLLLGKTLASMQEKEAPGRKLSKD